MLPRRGKSKHSLRGDREDGYYERENEKIKLELPTTVKEPRR